MFRRRSGILGMGGNSHALQPILVIWFSFAVTAGKRLLDKVETLIEAIAADHSVVWCGPDAVYRIVSSNHVSSPHCKRIDAQKPTQFINGAFNGKRGLRCAVPAKRAGRDSISVDRVTNTFFVFAPISSHRGTK